MTSHDQRKMELTNTSKKDEAIHTEDRDEKTQGRDEKTEDS